jgi:murein DD-endopeptidase MepM/ murein hydrolase activator NlpD
MTAGKHETSGMHWGLDFAAADGTKIFAAQAGSVVHIGAADGFGQWIVIDHPTEAGSGTTVYGHMWDAHATGLRQGDQVAAGQHIAFVGNNGDSSGHHLHFEVHPTVWSPRSQQDPEPWLVGALEPGAQGVPDQPRPEAGREPKTDHDMLVEIYQLLMIPVPSRSIYRDNNQPVDIWRGMLLNIDGMAHEAYVEREALLGYEPVLQSFGAVRKTVTTLRHVSARRSSWRRSPSEYMASPRASVRFALTDRPRRRLPKRRQRRPQSLRERPLATAETSGFACAQGAPNVGYALPRVTCVV